MAVYRSTADYGSEYVGWIHAVKDAGTTVLGTPGYIYSGITPWYAKHPAFAAAVMKAALTGGTPMLAGAHLMTDGPLTTTFIGSGSSYFSPLAPNGAFRPAEGPRLG